MLGKCDTCETDLLMIKLLKTDKAIKGAEKQENMFPSFQENITIYNMVTSSQRWSSKFKFMGMQVE